MKFVVIESPWAGMGDFEKAKDYLRRCIRDSIARNEIPFASHAMFAYTEALLEHDPDQRTLGIELQKATIKRADLVAAYIDHGISQGMRQGLQFALYNNVPCVKRKLEE